MIYVRFKLNENFKNPLTKRSYLTRRWDWLLIDRIESNRKMGESNEEIHSILKLYFIFYEFYGPNAVTVRVVSIFYNNCLSVFNKKISMSMMHFALIDHIGINMTTFSKMWSKIDI